MHLSSKIAFGMNYVVDCADHRYAPPVVISIKSFPHSRLITGFVTRATRRVPQGISICLSFRITWVHSPGASGVYIARSVDKTYNYSENMFGNVLLNFIKYAESTKIGKTNNSKILRRRILVLIMITF